MAISEEEAIRRRRANLSWSDIKRENPKWSEIQIQDYLDKQQDIDTLSDASLTLQEQVNFNTQTNVDQQSEIDSNTAGVNNNANNIAQNSLDIAQNALNIAQNSLDITSVTNNFNAHDASTSEHGVTGDNVGTEDFAQTLIGGVVLLAEKVADASVTSSAIATTDVGAAPATYDQAYAQEQTDLINECKAVINTLVTDVTDIKDQLNAFLASNQTAKQMSTT